MMMKISAISCSAMIGIAVGAFGYSEIYPLPGIEFSSSFQEIVSNDQAPFWAAEVNGVSIFCKSVRADSHVKSGVLTGDITRDRVFRITVPSLHSVPTDTEMVGSCLIHEAQAETIFLDSYSEVRK